MKPTHVLLLSVALYVLLLTPVAVQNYYSVKTAQRDVDAALFSAIAPHSHATHITKQITDDRHLTSIQFTQDGEEWALDYLTPRELDSLKHLK